MRITIPTLGLASFLFLCLGAPACAMLLESWENDGFAGIGSATGPWMKDSKAPAGMTFAFSNKHVTEGEYSLAITTPGGWTQAISDSEDRTICLGDYGLRRAMTNKLMISIDVFADASIEWATMDVVMSGSGIKWIQLETKPMIPGDKITLRYVTDPVIAEQLDQENTQFKLTLIINSKGPGTIFLDNFRAD
ncbi:MAG: hypothetical protein WC360_04380 [Opitutales bacterium]